VASATETVTQTNRRLRQFLELPTHVRITENLLLETLSWEEYWVIVKSYAARLTGVRTGRMDADT
jgi:hypothetical protein